MKDEKFEKIDNTKYIDINVESELKDSFLAYAMAVNVSRAIPDVRDGLKPVHRRIIYTMGEMGLYSDKAHMKCARIVGECMGKYHPHGDSAVYDALVRLAQDFSIRLPLVDGHGNFGSVDGDGAAAMRYTEARMSKIANEMLRDIDKNTVDFYPNFDETLMQPTVLPSRFPNLLVNGSDGIAVGMATNIPPHNLGEVIDGVIALIDNKDLTIDQLIDIIPAPDFPTGGYICGRSAVREAYRNGKGGVIIRARAEIEERNNRSRIIVTEIPYQVNKSKLIIQISELVKDKRIEGISGLRDESDRDGMRIVIDLKKDVNPQVLLNQLYKNSQLQIKNSMILLALDKNQPKVMNLLEIIKAYLEYQIEIITKRTQYDLDKARERSHILEGLVIAVQDIDAVIKLIKNSRDRQDAQQKLIEKYDFSDKQANAILDMRLSKLTGLEIDKLNTELDNLHIEISKYLEILSNEGMVLDIIKTEIIEIKEKYSTPRKSEIDLFDYEDIDIGDLIEEHDVILSRTSSGYIKRLPLAEYKSQNRGGRGVTTHKTKDEDFVIDILRCSSHDDLLFFSNKGKVYQLKAYLVPEASKIGKGRAMINLLQLEAGEQINTVLPINSKEEGNLILATKNAMIKKTDIKEFSNIRKNGKIAIKMQDDDALVSVVLSTTGDELLIASDNGKCMRFSEANIRNTGRSSMGVKSMSIDKKENIISLIIINPQEQLLTVTANGYAKRTNFEDYRLQNRGGKGVKAGTFNDKTGLVVGMKTINEEQDVLAISDSGVTIRLHASNISLIGRSGQGVRIMKVAEGSKLISVAVAQREEIIEDTIEENITVENIESNSQSIVDESIVEKN